MPKDTWDIHIRPGRCDDPEPAGYPYPSGVAARSWIGCCKVVKMTLKTVLGVAEFHHKCCSRSVQKVCGRDEKRTV